MADEDTNWEYHADDGHQTESQQEQTITDEPEPAPVAKQPPKVTWSASEYMEHKHDAVWYAGLIAITVGLGALLYFFTDSIFSALLVPILGITIGVFASRRPQAITYELNESGITIAGKFYAYNIFKSFSVIDEGVVHSLLLSPIKRFMPPISAYFADEDGDKIVNTVGSHLPYEARSMERTERIARRLRF